MPPGFSGRHFQNRLRSLLGLVVKVPEGYFNNPAQYLAYVKQVLSEIKYNTINIAARQSADAPGAFWQNDPEIQTYLQISKNNQKP